MTRPIKTSAVVQEGGRIQIESRELSPGAQVEVIVLQRPVQGLRSIDDILAGYPGGRLFSTAEQADAYLRTERDAWDR